MPVAQGGDAQPFCQRFPFLLACATADNMQFDGISRAASCKTINASGSALRATKIPHQTTRNGLWPSKGSLSVIEAMGLVPCSFSNTASLPWMRRMAAWSSRVAASSKWLAASPVLTRRLLRI